MRFKEKEYEALKAAMEVMWKSMEALETRMKALEVRMDALTARAPVDEEDNEEERFRKGYEAILGYDYQKALDFGGDMR